MITFFTTTKNFTDKSLINQINAVKSWTVGNQYNCEVIIFQKSKGFEVLNEIPNIRIIDGIRSNERGVPYISEMFNRASQLARYDILCFLNADIIINDSFVNDLIKIHAKVDRGYLIVGQRIDTSFDFLIDYTNKNWWTMLVKKVGESSTIHPPLGSDIFAFPKGQYASGDLPDLLVGRPGWDLYMIYHARKRRFKLIDLSSSNMVIHQNHDYSHKSENASVKKNEDKYNLAFLPRNEEYEYILSYCNYKLRNGAIVKSYSNFDFQKYYVQEIKLYKPSYIKRFLLKSDISSRRMLYGITKKAHSIKNRSLIFFRFLKTDKIKFNIGSAGINPDLSWYPTDIRTLNITKYRDWEKHLLWLKVDNIMAEHVWEHLTDNDTDLANKNCFKYLKTNGVLRLAVPDGYHPSKEYIEYVKPGGHGLGAEDHKILYTYKTMMKRLEKVGFTVNLLEYWDEDGNFHFVDWTDEGGRITRSRRYDKRNADGQLNYTSLIVDAVKL